MTEVGVERTDDTGGAFTFNVRVADRGSETIHAVTLGSDDFARLAREGEQPEAFVQRCFDFLLERESKESILPNFDVLAIGRYFPEFEDTITGA
ncbi:MAG: hypothetical protein WD757_00075 [Actinomycetota bacterium]